MEFIDEKGGNPGRAVTEAPTEKVRIDLDQLLKRRGQASRFTLPYLEGYADCALVAGTAVTARTEFQQQQNCSLTFNPLA